MAFESHDPAWLIALAKQQRPDLPWLTDSLAGCTMAAWRSRQHVYLVFPEPEGGNTTLSTYRETISLDDPKCGHIMLDVAVDNRIIGVEFYDRLFSKNSSRRRRNNNLRRQKRSDKS